MTTILTMVLGLVALVCYIMIVVKMFQNDAVVVGIICALTFFCIGPLIALIFGWIKAKDWNMTNLMIAYTACFILSSVLGGISSAMQSAVSP